MKKNKNKTHLKREYKNHSPHSQKKSSYLASNEHVRNQSELAVSESRKLLLVLGLTQAASENSIRQPQICDIGKVAFKAKENDRIF